MYRKVELFFLLQMMINSTYFFIQAERSAYWSPTIGEVWSPASSGTSTLMFWAASFYWLACLKKPGCMLYGTILNRKRNHGEERLYADDLEDVWWTGSCTGLRSWCSRVRIQPKGQMFVWRAPELVPKSWMFYVWLWVRLNSFKKEQN